MTYYMQEVQRIKEACFSNEEQLAIVLNAKRYIDGNFAEDIGLPLIARRQLTSQYHLIRVFKKYLGITPRQYLINKRIEVAKGLLRSGKSVSESCYGVGFASVSSFSILFKAKTGVSPAAYGRATFDKPMP